MGLPRISIRLSCCALLLAASCVVATNSETNCTRFLDSVGDVADETTCGLYGCCEANRFLQSRFNDTLTEVKRLGKEAYGSMFVKWARHLKHHCTQPNIGQLKTICINTVQDLGRSELERSRVESLCHKLASSFSGADDTLHVAQLAMFYLGEEVSESSEIEAIRSRCPRLQILLSTSLNYAIPAVSCGERKVDPYDWEAFCYNGNFTRLALIDDARRLERKRQATNPKSIEALRQRQINKLESEIRKINRHIDNLEIDHMKAEAKCKRERMIAEAEREEIEKSDASRLNNAKELRKLRMSKVRNDTRVPLWRVIQEERRLKELSQAHRDILVLSRIEYLELECFQESSRIHHDIGLEKDRKEAAKRLLAAFQNTLATESDLKRLWREFTKLDLRHKERDDDAQKEYREMVKKALHKIQVKILRASVKAADEEAV